MAAPLALLLPVLDRVLNTVIPDPVERARVVMESQSQLTDALQKSDAAQSAVNLAEATSPHPAAALWRPAAGWVAVAGLFYDVLMRPLLPWVLAVQGLEAPPLPELGDTLWALLFGMLGLGAMRSFDKLRGTDLRRVP